MSHEAFAARYRVPLRNPAQARPELEWSRRGEGRLRSVRGGVRRQLRGRRLAYIDSHFPWKLSGFRYADALALHRLRPDTVFFSLYELTDPFPAPVLPLASFPRLAPALGITDVYGVFLDFMAGVLGLAPPDASVISGPDLFEFIRRHEMRAHVGLWPGGGFTVTDERRQLAREVSERAATVLAWSEDVLSTVPSAVEIAPAIIDTRFYSAAKTPRFETQPLELLFVADAKPRKGLARVIGAMATLTDIPVRLHVVGPHVAADWDAPVDRVTFHGWCSRDALRALHRRCQVFVSPVSAEAEGDHEGDGGVTDGFPTTAAGDAMSSGLLLVSANPAGDHRFLTPEIDYMEVASEAESVASTIRRIVAEPVEAAMIARSGCRVVRAELDVERGARQRLTAMGLGEAGPTRLWDRQRALLEPPDVPRAVQDAVVSVADQADAIESLTRTVIHLRRTLDETRREFAVSLNGVRRDLGHIALDDEHRAVDLLWQARGSDEYVRPFTDPEPLVTIIIPTFDNVEALVKRSLPSVLVQEHERLEVIVVGDLAPPDVAAEVRRIDDDRVRYEDLGVRAAYPEDDRQRWLVAGIPALNRGLELARGQWIVVHNDDDALRPHHVSRLLDLARDRRVEVAYGRFATHFLDGSHAVDGVFPPENHRFGWQTAIQHRAMRRFRYSLAAAEFDLPGDWERARRMLRAGVRFAMTDEVVFDYYPGTLWRRDDSLPTS